MILLLIKLSFRHEGKIMITPKPPKARKFITTGPNLSSNAKGNSSKENKRIIVNNVKI